MKVAVTGGSGFVGREVVRELLGRGHRVALLSRRRPEDMPLDDRLEYRPGNVVDSTGLADLVRGQDAVIHLVGIIREVLPYQTFDAVHRRSTANVLSACRDGGVRRYLHMSAMGTRATSVSRYHRTKWEAEELVRSSGLSWTIFRPSIIFGPRDAFINMLLGVMRKTPVMPVVGGGSNRMQPVFVGDVAKAFACALERDLTIGRTYELGGPEVLTFKDILKVSARVAGMRRAFLPVPIAAARAGVRFGEELRLPLPVTSDQLAMLGEDNVRTGGAPLDDLGFPFTRLEDGLKEYLKP